jgi:aquaporin related protein
MYLATLLQRRRERRFPKPGHSLPMLHLPPTVRNNLVATLGEFVGTFLFLFMAFAGTQIAHTPAPKPDALPDAAAYILVCLTSVCLSLPTYGLSTESPAACLTLQ